MKSIALVIFCVFTFLILGCASQPAEPSRPSVTWTKDAATSEEIENAKATVINQLKDPESARFGEFWAMNGTNGRRTICGYVNAKNSFGGYTGRKMFTVNEDRVIMEGNDALGGLLPGLCTPRTVE